MAGFEAIDIKDSAMQCYFAGDDPSRPGVLVCMHAPGVDEFIQDICARLDDAGYVAAAPDVYHRQTEPIEPLEKMARLNDHEIIEDFAATSAALRGRSDPSRQYVVGFCMGGRLAYLWAAEADVGAAVFFYPGNTMQSWGHDGRSPFDRSPDIDCPVLGIFGNDDQNPSPQDADAIATRLADLGKVFTSHRYDGAGHAFLNAQRPPAFRPEQAADAWQKCVDFLNKHSR